MLSASVGDFWLIFIVEYLNTLAKIISTSNKIASPVNPTAIPN